MLHLLLLHLLLQALLFTSLLRAVPSNYIGCFQPPLDVISVGYHRFMSVGWCQSQCSSREKLVAAVTNGTDCYCSNLPPVEVNAVPEMYCDKPCAGYAMTICIHPPFRHHVFLLFLTDWFRWWRWLLFDICQTRRDRETASGQAAWLRKGREC